MQAIITRTVAMGNTTTANTSPFNPFILSLLLLVLLVLLPSVVLGRAHGRTRAWGDEENEEGKTKQLLEPLANAVDRALDFFSEDFSTINVDGLFGMRVAQGQLMEALRECKNNGSCPEDLQRRLQAMVHKIDIAAEAAMTYVKDEDPDYFNRFIQVIDKPMVVPYRPRILGHLDTTLPGLDSSYEEEMGDGCMARVMGTYEDDDSGKTVEKCNVTKTCWDFMTQGGMCHYAITHQVIYLSFIEKQGCTEKVEKTMKAKVSQIQERMCGSIYNEAAQEVKDDKVEDISQDLFLEQVMICGILGFENFMRSDWMRMVLRWQRPTGCFSMDDPKLLQMEKEIVKAEEEQRQLMMDLKLEASRIDQQHGHGRKLLREHIMPDGCLSHKTGLGVTNLALFLRYVIRQNFIVQ